MKIKKTLFIACLCITSFSYAQNDLAGASDKELEEAKNGARMVQVSGNTYMIAGKGGNIAVHFGAEEILMIDDKFENSTEQILTRIRNVNEKKPISFLINTHHHGDHTGGNENMQKEGATIIAHENVRKNMRIASRVNEEALPKITFTEDMKLWFDGQEIYAFHVDKAK